MREPKKTAQPATQETGRAPSAGTLQRSGMPRGMTRESTTANPFTLMRRMFDDMDRMFEGFVGGREALSQEAWTPQIEVLERNNRLVVKADLPGIKPEDIRVQVDEDGLYLEGERRSEEQHEHDGVIETERTYGSFARRVPLPRNVDLSKEQVSFKDGVLEISFDLKTAGRRTLDVGGGTATQAQSKPPTVAQPPQQQPAAQPQAAQPGQARNGTGNTGEASRH